MLGCTKSDLCCTDKLECTVHVFSLTCSLVLRRCAYTMTISVSLTEWATALNLLPFCFHYRLKRLFTPLHFKPLLDTDADTRHKEGALFEIGTGSTCFIWTPGQQREAQRDRDPESLLLSRDVWDECGDKSLFSL